MKLYLKYRMLTLVSIVGLMVYVSCGDDTFFKSRPEESGALTTRKKEDVEILDSLKNAFKGNSLNKSYPFTVNPKGADERATTYLIYTLEGEGGGALFRDGKVVKDSVKVFTPEAPISLVFTPAGTKGDLILRFASYNQFGLESKNSTVVRLHVFENKPPVAKFKLTATDAAKYKYNLDGSASFDSDGKIGGSVKMYEYTIYWNGKPLPLVRVYDPVKPIQLSGAGTYTITLRVQDNDADFSGPAVRTYTL